MTSQAPTLEQWYHMNGRHEVPWRQGRSRWEVLVAEVMCCQTQLGRVVATLDDFLKQFPDPSTTAAAGQAAVVAAWGRLGYPRRARDLYVAATIITASGWPDDLTELPGVGPWVAAATAAQADNANAFGFDVNVRRVAQRTLGRRASDAHLMEHFTPLLAPLAGRDRLLAALDLGALCCTRSAPNCTACPLLSSCVSKGPLANETKPRRQAPYHDSMRQRRGNLLDALRTAPLPVEDVDPHVLASLTVDGLVVLSDGLVRLA